MATGRGMQLTRQVGEYLVSSELCRMGFIATTFTGNVPEFDILAINDRFETKPIQVKTIERGDWQLRADRFLNILVSDAGIQEISGKKHPPYSDLICVFLKLLSLGKDEIFVLRWKHLQDIVCKKYGNWLREHAGKRPKNPKSMHCSVSPKDLSKFRNWDLLKKDRVR